MLAILVRILRWIPHWNVSRGEAFARLSPVRTDNKPAKASPVFTLASVLCLLLLSGCGGNPGLLNVPFDPGGRSLNSLAAEVAPEIAGQYIAFVSERQQRQNIYLYDFQTRHLVDIPGLNAIDSIASDPDVSADGRYIVFAAIRQGKSGIYFYDRQTRQLRNLTADLPAEVRNPTLSADGNTIAFESSANGQWDILVYDRSGQPLDVPLNPQ